MHAENTENNEENTTGNTIGNAESIQSSIETSVVQVKAQVSKLDKKKRKVTETPANDKDNDDPDLGKIKPSRPKSSTWEHFTRDPNSKRSNPRAKFNWCRASYTCDSHRNGATNMRYHLLN